MTYAEQIPLLPELQRDAVRHLMVVPNDPEAIADALHAGVPPAIVSFAASRPAETVEHIAHDFDVRVDALNRAIANAA